MSTAELNIRVMRVDDRFSDIPLPCYATSGSAGMDIHAAVGEPLTVRPGETVLVPTNVCIELPMGYEAQVRPRSGLAIKNSIGLLNAPGTIDSDYRGEIKIILRNFGYKEFVIHKGDRIAHLVVAQYVRANWLEVEKLGDTERGSGGFGHTGR